jgi:hypothetical protein
MTWAHTQRGASTPSASPPGRDRRRPEASTGSDPCGSHQGRTNMRNATTRGDYRHTRTRMPTRKRACIDPLLTFMVRRGSTVRVRQRASQKGLQNGGCRCLSRRRIGPKGTLREHFLTPSVSRRVTAPEGLPGEPTFGVSRSSAATVRARSATQGRADVQRRDQSYASVAQSSDQGVSKGKDPGGNRGASTRGLESSPNRRKDALTKPVEEASWRAKSGQ